MRYQHLKTTRKINKLLVPFIPVCIALLLLLSEAQMPSFLTNATHSVAVPFWSFKNNMSSLTGNAFNSLKSKDTLLEENTALQEEIIKLRREVFVSKVHRTENTRLLEVLARTNDQSNIFPASVMHNDTHSPFDTFIIDVGTSDGIRNDMLVITPEGIAVGTITNTLKHTATVKQFSAPKTTLEVFLHASTSFHTTLLGQGSGTMLMTVPRDVSLSINDVVTLPNFSTYPVGEVTWIEVAPEDAYKKVYVRSPVNTHELRYVLIDATAVWKMESQETTRTFEVLTDVEENEDTNEEVE